MHITRREFELAVEKDIYTTTNSKIYCNYTGNFLQIWFKGLTFKQYKKVNDYLKTGLALIEVDKDANEIIKSYYNSKNLKIRLFELPENTKNSLAALIKIKGLI